MNDNHSSTTNATLTNRDGSTRRVWAEGGDISESRAALDAGQFLPYSYEADEWEADGVTESGWFVVGLNAPSIRFDE